VVEEPDWENLDKFQVDVEDVSFLFAFHRTGSGEFIAKCLTPGFEGAIVEADSLPECREAAAEAIELYLEDMREDGEVDG
jgi:predicted RNase H-like HicB family nuclease